MMRKLISDVVPSLFFPGSHTLLKIIPLYTLYVDTQIHHTHTHTYTVYHLIRQGSTWIPKGFKAMVPIQQRY